MLLFNRYRVLVLQDEQTSGDWLHNNDRAIIVFLGELEGASEVLRGREFVQSLLGFVFVHD